MFIMTRSIVVEKGYAEQVIERFSKGGAMDGMPGLIDRTVMINRRARDNEEVLVMIRWESEEAWKNWEKSDAHIQGHRDNKGKTPPEYVISTTVNTYHVKAVRPGAAANS